MNKSANFSNIHKFYDLINSLITFGFDRSWRRQAAANLKQGNVLDLGSGTGASYDDLKRFDVVALDPDKNMLSLNKFQNKVVGISENLPFDNNFFDNVFCCFVLRNVDNIEKTFSEVARVLRKDGKFILLDMSRPRNNFLKQFHKIGTYLVLHLIGLITFNLKEYRFLHFSLDKLPPPEDLLVDINLEKKMLKRTGLFGFVYLGVFENCI